MTSDFLREAPYSPPCSQAPFLPGTQAEATAAEESWPLFLAQSPSPLGSCLLRQGNVLASMATISTPHTSPPPGTSRELSQAWDPRLHLQPLSHPVIS